MLQDNLYILPTEKEMCLTYGISRQTLRKALDLLKKENVITSRQGSGYELTGLYPSRTNRIVLLMESDEAYLDPFIISELSRAFDRYSCQTSVITTDGDTARERDALLSLVKSPPRGLFAWASHSALPSPNADLYHQLWDRGTAIVFPAGRSPNISAGKTALQDNVQGGDILTEYLIREGHTAIGMILLEDDAAGHERYLGYCSAMIRHGLPISDQMIFKIPPNYMNRIRHDPKDQILSQNLSFLPRGLTALICQTDELAFNLIRILENRKVRVPEMISVAGFDDSHLRSAGHISLTTMRPYPQSVSEHITALMMELLRPGTSMTAENGWELIPGGSTAPLH